MRRSTLNAIIAFVLVVVLAIGVTITCAIGSSGFTNSNFSTWFNSWGKGSKVEQEIVDQHDSGLISPGEASGDGMKITAATIASSLYETYGISPIAEAALTLTVTPTPADAELTGGKFTIAFKNASSAWATGKTVTEYVTLSQSNEKQATVSCLKAFGEPIVITYTVKGENGANKTATYQLDYRARITGAARGLLLNNSERYDIHGDEAYEYVNPTSLDATLLFSEHTIQETFTITSCKIALSDVAKAQLKEQNITPVKNEITNGAKISGAELTWDITGLMDTIFGATAWKTAAFREVAENGTCLFNIFITVTDGYSECIVDDEGIGFREGFPKAAQSVQFSGGSQHTF